MPTLKIIPLEKLPYITGKNKIYNWNEWINRKPQKFINIWDANESLRYGDRVDVFYSDVL